MHRFAPLALATLLAATASAYISAQTTFTDPANLRGERVSARTGRELPIDQGALGLEELLRKLSTRASVLNIVAHPDDEDGGMLTLYSRGYGARVADLSLTRGEGGQNAMTGDFEDALGLLRTQELLSNDRYTGVTQMFGTEVDFGFSKTKSEAFAKWGHDRVLYDAVRAIRLFRPLVITATFIGAPTDGHGQHQVSGQIAQEAFVAAGDPNVFPELTKEGILPWQPLKMYARAPTYAISAKGLFDYATGQYVPAEFTNYVTGVTSTTPPTPDITIHEGTTDPLLTTCAANPADLDPATNLSSRPEASQSGAVAERPAVPSSTADCRPLSYVQFARIGLGLQRSQIGPGVRNAPSGRFDVAYHLYGSRLCGGTSISLKNCHPEPERREGEGSALPPAVASEPNFFDGIDTSLEGIATLAPDAKGDGPLALIANLAVIAQSIESAQKQVSSGHTQDAANDLATALNLVNNLVNNLTGLKLDLLPQNQKANILHELRIKRVQLNDALVLALGLKLDATSPADNLRAGSTAVVTTRFSARSSVPLHDVEEGIENSSGNGLGDGASFDGEGPHPLPGRPLEKTLSLGSPETNQITRPYFFRTDIEQPVYEIRDPHLRNAAQAPPALSVFAKATYNGALLTLARVVHDGPQPVSFVPPANLAAAPHAQVLPNSDNYARFLTELHPTAKPPLIPKIAVPKGWTVSPLVTDVAADGFSFFKLVAPRAPRSAITLSAAVALSDHKLITEGFRPVGYGDLPRTNFYTPATVRIVPVDLKLPPPDKRRIAYLEGTGDDVPSALASIGLKPTILTVADLTPEKLSHFDTVILGVRTYNAHPDLHGAPTQALLDFARSGGNVLVQYQTNEFTAADAPFPLGLHGERVIDETAPVKLLDPDSPFLTTPNKITAADFNHWIEERGHGFLDSWDAHYTALTETHDPGSLSEHIAEQAPQRGGLITVPLGKGHWTYCAFALYRQLPEAVPGAYRLFVNLLNP